MWVVLLGFIPLTFLFKFSSCFSFSTLDILLLSLLRLGENLKAATAAPAPRRATPPVATAATLPSAPSVAAAMVPEPGKRTTVLAAVSIPESDCLLDLGGEREVGVCTGEVEMCGCVGDVCSLSMC